MIRSMIKRLNKALPALLLGIVLYGLLVQFIGVWTKWRVLCQKHDCRMVPSKIYDSSDHIFCHVKISLRKCTNGICRSHGIKGSSLSAAFYS